MNRKIGPLWLELRRDVLPDHVTTTLDVRLGRRMIYLQLWKWTARAWDQMKKAAASPPPAAYDDRAKMTDWNEVPRAEPQLLGVTRDIMDSAEADLRLRAFSAADDDERTAAIRQFFGLPPRSEDEPAPLKLDYERDTS